MAERPQTSEQTNASALFQLMSVRIPGIVWSTDADLRITSVLGAGLAALGISSDDLVGKTLSEIGQTDDEQFPPVMGHRRALRGESVDYDRHWRERVLRCHVERLADEAGAVIGCVGFAQDVTEQVRSEAALQKAREELEQRVAARTAELSEANELLKREAIERRRVEGDLAIFHRFAEAAGQGLGMGSLDGYIAYVNPAMSRLVEEKTPDDMVGKRFWEYYPEDWMERRAKEVLPALEQNGYWDAEQEVLTSQGKRIPTLHHVFLVRDDNGTPVRRAFVVTDITEYRKAQEALEKEHRTLRHLLQSSDHERQLIAYEIHDGLAQQLAGAIMQFQTYAHLKTTQPNEAAHAYDAGMTMLQQGHFEVRRLISGVRPPILDESGIVAAVAHLVNEQRLQKGPRIEFRSDVEFDRLAPLLENAIYRIVQEGLANAYKHSGSKRLRTEMTQCGETLRITIRDWGVGFDPALVQDDRFGLEGIRERARLLGGNITVESAPDQGTCLTVELPLVFRK
jgi:PAS domain S-box-containing protein